MTPKFRYRPLETVLGFYAFGKEYTVFAGEPSHHALYTSVHESTHAILGWSTSFGIFQKFVAYLSNAGPPATSLVAAKMLAASIEDVRPVHEATATFAEFMAAHAVNYSGLPEMEKDLSDEYREWRALYDGVFQDTVPYRARWCLAEHISRCAMDTDILSDYCELSLEKIRGFSKYLDYPDKSPRKRFASLLGHVKQADQERLFENYLREYRHNERDLLDAYETRSFDARQRSLAIQSGLRRAFEVYKPRLDLTDDAWRAIGFCCPT